MKLRTLAAGFAVTAVLGASAVAATPAQAATTISVPTPVGTSASAGGVVTTQGLDWLFCYLQPKYCAIKY